MGNFFPRWTNWLPLKLAVAAGFIVFGVSLAVPYYFTPKYTRVGYEPTQPVPFSHKVHAGQLGLDCRYCHSFAEVSSHANVPTNQTCFNCHGPGKGNIKSASPKLEKVIKAAEAGYFNHSAHLNRGISCQNCHGQINEMEVVKHDQPQSMGWCLNCHRNPEQMLRPLDQITNLNYKPEQLDRTNFYAGLLKKGIKADEIAATIEEGKTAAKVEDLVALAAGKFGEKVTQLEVGSQLKKHWQVQPPDSCTACHR
jgi:hypothetical protein